MFTHEELQMMYESLDTYHAEYKEKYAIVNPTWEEVEELQAKIHCLLQLPI